MSYVVCCHCHVMYPCMCSIRGLIHVSKMHNRKALLTLLRKLVPSVYMYVWFMNVLGTVVVLLISCFPLHVFYPFISTSTIYLYGLPSSILLLLLLSTFTLIVEKLLLLCIQSFSCSINFLHYNLHTTIGLAPHGSRQALQCKRCMPMPTSIQVRQRVLWQQLALCLSQTPERCTPPMLPHANVMPVRPVRRACTFLRAL